MHIGRRAPSLVAAGALVVANLPPLVGVIWFGLSVFDVLVLYWIENGIVGAITVRKGMLAQGKGPVERPILTFFLGNSFATLDDIDDPPSQPGARARSIGQFVLGYGIFWLGHGLLVFMLGATYDPRFGQGFESTLGTVVFGVGVLSLVASHWLSYRANFIGRDEYLTVSLSTVGIRPFARSMLLHFVVLFGGVAIVAVGSTLPAIVLFVAFKTGADLIAHLLVHRDSEVRRAVDDGP